jgi:hypothetical protein
MKKILLLSLTLLTLTASAKPFQSPDIVVVTKLDKDWSSFLVSKVRRLLRNFNILDPFLYNYDGSLTVSDTTLGTDLPTASRSVINDFGNILGLDIFNTKTKVSLHGFQYEVKGFKTDLKAIENDGGNFKAKMNFSASEIYVEAGKISLDVVIPTQDGRTTPVITIDIVKPVIRSSNENLVNFFAQLQIIDAGTQMNLKIDELNLDQLTKNLIASSISIDYERINIPRISVRIGNRTVNFDPRKIQNYLRRNHEGIKGFILSQTAKILKRGVSDALLALVQRYKVDKKFWLPTPSVRSQLEITKFTGFPNSNDLVINLMGDFCTISGYDIYKDGCVFKKLTGTAPSRLTPGLHNQSMQILHDFMLRGEADMMASASEDYLNKHLAGTIDAGLWKEALDTSGIKLGPNKITLRLNKIGDTGMLVLDGIYKMKRFEQIATGVREIRFPLVLNVGIRFENKEDIPTLIIRSHSVDTTDSVLMNGIPELGIESSIGRVSRFRSKVLKAIREALAGFNNKDILPIPMQELSGLSLEDADFHSDGKGRIYGILKLEDIGLDEN